MHPTENHYIHIGDYIYQNADVIPNGTLPLDTSAYVVRQADTDLRFALFGKL